MKSMTQRKCVIVALAITAIALSSVDVFGQLIRRRNDNDRQGVRPAVRESFKVEVFLESNSSARQEWSLVAFEGGKPIHKVLEPAGNEPGASTVDIWNFGAMNRSAAGRMAKFRFKFFDSDDHEYKAEFVLYPREGKVRFNYTTGIGLSWDIDEDSTFNLAPTKRTLSSARNMPGAPTTDEWSLGKVLNSQEEGIAVFNLNFRGHDFPEVIIKLRQ